MKWIASGFVIAGLAAAIPASAEIIDKTGLFNGLKVQYRVITPPGYDPAKAYPIVLVFTGGGQQWTGVQANLDADWKDEAAKRGYILVSPAATDGQLYFEGGDRIFPAFFEAISRDYKIAGRWHVAGHSNGGLSAYHVAAQHPSQFSTVTGYPGLIDPDEMSQAPALKPLCLYIHVGEHDELGWRDPITAEAAQLKKSGYRIAFTVEPNQGHRLHAKEIDLSRRLFDEIESCK
jgi:poly(3-hydroxybutyrate) depolymerase